MVAFKILSVLAAAGLVAASNDPCSNDFKINSQSDASALASCQTVKGKVTIGSQTGATIDISGPKEIKGDLTLEDNGIITSLMSSTLQTIGGNFLLNNVTVLSNLGFTSLQSVNQISWTSLPALGQLNFGTPGVTTAQSVSISDTFLSSMDGIDLTSVATMNLNNNGRLSDITSQLGTVSNIFSLNANGLHLKVNLPNLIWAANLTFSNITELSLPSLHTINGSLRMDSNFFTSFSAPNLTETQSGDVSFVSNGMLGNLSFPVLTKCGGAIVVANNTQLDQINSFPKLQTVGGAIAERGNFTSFSFPSLKDVKGTADITSTTNIDKSCSDFMTLSPTSQGGNGVIQGKVDCTSNNAHANNDTSSSSSGGSGGSSSGSGNKNVAAGLSMNMAAVFSFTALAGLVSALL